MVVLADGFELGDIDDDTECGCLVTIATIDGVEVEQHHWLPDDFAPHVPDTECGCGPVLHDQRPARMLFEHFDQDALDHALFHGDDAQFQGPRPQH